MAAGLGSRLGALTERLPKALITVAGQTLLARAVAFARAVTEGEIIVVGGFQFARVAAEVQRLGLPVTLVENPHFRDGNLVSLLTARAAVGQRGFLLMNVDHIYRPTIACLAALPADDITAFVDHDRTLGGDDMKVARDPSGRVRYISKQLGSFDCGYVGMTRVPAEASARYWLEVDAALAAEGRAISVERVLGRLAEEGDAPLCRDISGHGWLEVDLPEERDHAERVLAAGAW